MLNDGLKWETLIPVNWRTVSVNRIFILGRGRVINQEDIAQNVGDYPVYSSQTENSGNLGSINSYDFEGDYITWTTDGANAGTVFNRTGKFNCTNVCGTLKQSNDLIVSNSYVTYCLQVATKEYVRYDINPKLMNNVMARIRFPLPEYKLQKQIADFLDKETTRIDTLISRKQKQIELLKEKRQVIITHAVTKGLDPNVKMKDSGVEWIGEIPEHWNVKKSKFVLSFNDETLSENCDPNKVIQYVEIGDVNSEEGIRGFTEYEFKDSPSRARRIVKLGDVIISTVRTYLKAISPIKEEYQDVIVSTGFVVLRPDDIELSSVFSSYYFSTPHFLDDVVSWSVGVSYPACKPEDIVNIKICIPPINEQEEISKFLGTEVSRISTLKENIKKSITLLKEFRSSLITHAVSGQIDLTEGHAYAL